MRNRKRSSGAPILNINNFKIIGIHQGTKKMLSLNVGILLTNIIKMRVELYNKILFIMKML